MAFLLPILESAAPFLLSSFAGPLLGKLGDNFKNNLVGPDEEQGGMRKKVHEELGLRNAQLKHHGIKPSHFVGKGKQARPVRLNLSSRSRPYHTNKRDSGGFVGPSASVVGRGITNGASVPLNDINSGPIP